MGRRLLIKMHASQETCRKTSHEISSSEERNRKRKLQTLIAYCLLGRKIYSQGFLLLVERGRESPEFAMWKFFSFWRRSL